MSLTIDPSSLEFRQRPIEFRIVKEKGKKQGRILADVLPYDKVDDYRTRFRPGSFTASLQDHLPVMLWSHNMLDPIGRWIDADDTRSRLRMLGQLDLERDEETRMPIVPQAHRAWLQLDKRTVNQFSVGFIRQESSPSREHRGVTDITRGVLDEVSPVVAGSVPGTALLATRSRILKETVQSRVERRRIFNMETRANPIGYNQYKHLHGPNSGVAVPGGGGSKSQSESHPLPGGGTWSKSDGGREVAKVTVPFATGNGTRTLSMSVTPKGSSGSHQVYGDVIRRQTVSGNPSIKLGTVNKTFESKDAAKAYVVKTMQTSYDLAQRGS